MEKSRILVVDDDAPFRGRLEEAFVRRGYEVCVADAPGAALKIAAEFRPTHAVIDLRLGAQSGIPLLPELSSHYGTTCVVLPGYGSVATALEAVRCGAANYLAKPIAMEALLGALFGEPLSCVTSNDEDEAMGLERAEWEHIQRVLRESDGNITHAAKKLGIHRQALQRKLRQPPA